MKISFLIPVYNVDKYIRNCLNSLYSQINDSCEVILVDDGSTDLSGDICDEYKLKYPKVTKVFHKQNQGAYPTRNYALDEAIGKYIWLIDPDDYIEKGIIKKLFDDSHFQDGDMDIITMAYQRFNTQEDTNLQNYYNEMMVISGRDYLLTKDFNPYLWCNLYRKDFLIDNKLRFDDRLYSQGDWVFNIQAYMYAKKMLLTNYLSYHYFVGNQTSTLTSHDVVHRKRNANNSLLAITDVHELLSVIKDTELCKVIKKRLDFSACGFIYSLYLCNFPIEDVENYLKKLSALDIFPIKSKQQGKGDFFRRFCNCKMIFLLSCKFRNLIYPKYTITKLL